MKIIIWELFCVQVEVHYIIIIYAKHKNMGIDLSIHNIQK